MYNSKILVGCVVLLYVFFAFFEVLGEYNLAYHLDSLIIPLITVIYLLFVKNKSILFMLFLLLYSISDLLGIAVRDVLVNNSAYDDDHIVFEYDYYIGSTLYILAYLFLFFKIASSLSFIHVIKHYKIHLLVLSILNVYLVYVLQVIVEPNIYYEYEYAVELVYNIVMLSVLSAALLNYFYRDNKKSFYLFIGSLCLVFSEVIDIAFIYLSERSLLNILGTSLALGAFYFFYQQSKLLNEENGEKNYMVLD